MKPTLILRSIGLLCLLITFLLVPYISKAQPANDNHGGFPFFLTAPALTVNGGGTCTVVTSGDIRNATISATIPAFTCASNSFLFDVWYKFTATSSNHTIRLSNYGTNYTRRQFAVYQFNTSGTLSAVTCSALSTSGTAALSVNFIDYSPGTTYLVRVMYPNTVNTGPTLSNSTFDLCVTTGTNNPVQPVLSGKSYTNITRPTGGTIQSGDVLEFRQAINVGSWSIGAGSIYNVTYHDTIPAGLSYVPNSIKFESNEGLQIQSGISGSVNLTDASGDDEAIYNGGVMRVNVGSLPRDGGAGAANRQYVHEGSPAVTPITYLSAGGGKIHSRGRPNQFGGFVALVVRYQVTVTAATGTTFTTSNGQFRYKTTTSSIDDITFPQTIVNFPRYTVYVSAPGAALCRGGSGINVYTGGDFGSGTTRHDSTQLTLAPQYTWTPFTNGNPGDGFFAVVNNTSSNRNFTNKFAPFPSTGVGADTVRVFNVWDIIGDHTGATNPDSGNLAVPWGTNGGYMAVVNAAYGINTAVQRNITGLCSDTYYEFSAWFKNICAGCSSDSTGRTMSSGALFKNYLPIKTLNDSAGVSPDLTYTIDGIDYYSTGAIIYDKRWVKKGFLFRTGPTQTSVTLTIRNNAPGGGGNDWAIDDIALTTCFPGMTYSPSANPNICEDNILTIRDTVRSVFDNYVQYKWQRWPAITSGPWADIPGATGTATPVWNPTLGVYEYVSSYTIPVSGSQPANQGDRFRLVVASTTSNLTSATCSYSDPGVITLNVIPNCGPVLKTDLLSATGKLTNNFAKISWVSSKEDDQVNYNIERSDDGINFISIAMVNGYNDTSAVTNNYSYIDPVAIVHKAYYRVVLINGQNRKKYSAIIRLNTDENHGFNFGTVVNPFNNNLEYELVSSDNGTVKVELIDNYGRVVKTETLRIYQGVNALVMSNTSALSKGIYILKAIFNGNLIVRKILKN